MTKFSIALVSSIIILAVITSCGKEEDPPEPTPTPNPLEVRYDPDVKAVLSNNCIGCHGTSNPNAGLSLTTYSEVRNAVEMGNLINRVNSSSNPMPPSGRMSSQNRQVFQDWADDGYLE